MRNFSDSAVLLTAWEEAAAAPVVARGAVLVHRAGLTPDLDAALDLDVGECAALAMQVHTALFGREVQALIACTRCAERLELQLRLPDASGGGIAQVGGLTVRAPSTRDLLAAAGRPGDGRAVLFSRCVRHGDGTPVRPTDLTADEEAAVDAAAERLAGAAALVLRTRCPACEEDVRAALDPGALLWDQVDATAPTLLDEVATLARCFGWSEAEVLAMSLARRSAYLKLAEQ